jgi:hypothetical protein
MFLFIKSAANKYSSRSLIAIGCANTLTHCGVVMIGNRSATDRIISKDRLPEPIS